MIPETNDLIEKFILGKLNGDELNDFHGKMKNSKKFAQEVKLNQEITHSIFENDIMDLRSNLRNIFSDEKNQPANKALFDFTRNLNNTFCQNEFSPDISTTENLLQQIHLENHLKNNLERIHQISSKTEETHSSILSNQINDFLFEDEIKEAILEKDVIDLRSNLKEISSQGFISFSDYEIDQYRSNELTQIQMQEIDNLAKTNELMNSHIRFHEEIDQAISETDIFSLRNSLDEIIEEEQQINFNEIKRIDDYLMEYLDEKNRSEYELLLEDNIKLKNETSLNFEINKAIIEKDVINLRSSLSEIIEENKQSSKIRKFIPDNFQNLPIRYVGAAASIAAIVSVGLLSLTQQKTSSDKLFQQAYQPYNASGLFRSAQLTNPSFKGIDLYNLKNYDGAIDQFSIVLNENGENPMCNFYTGLCFLEKKQYSKAIFSFQKVISEKDNLFIEQAEWYMALGYLKTSDEKKAYIILNRIIENNGYYRKNAKELLKKLKYD